MRRMKKKPGILLCNVPLIVIHVAIALVCTLVPLVLTLVSVWHSTDAFIASTYGKSLYSAVASIPVSNTSTSEEAALATREWLEQASPGQAFTYYILGAAGNIEESGCNMGTMIPLDSSALKRLPAPGYCTYRNQYRGDVLAIRTAFTNRYDLIVLYSFSNFRSAGEVFGKRLLWVIPINLTLLAVGIWILWRYQIHPARTLVVTMKSPSMNNATDRYVHWRNEIGQMCAAYQERYADYLQSLQEINQLNNDRRESEVDVLQNQINAHFIYNTLNNIQWLATANRMEDVIHTAKSLDTLLRGLAKNDSDFVRLEEEIAYVDAYLSSQKIRFRDVFDYEFQIDPLLLMGKIPKFIIQPIVENSIYHGFLDAHRKNGHIRIDIRSRGHRILITVEDNGCGIEESRIYHILNNTQKSSGQYMGVAIGNIDKRIRLLCGREYGLGIESVPDKYTRVEISIPYME